MTTRTLSALTAAAAALVLLAGCASATSPGGSIVAGGDPLPTPATTGSVLAQGTVLQIGDATPQLCLGVVAESYPPQCNGPEIAGWDWTAVEMKETAEEVTWGAFALTGTWDGAVFTSTAEPIPLALFDPAMSAVDPRVDLANAGAGDEGTLLRIKDELDASAGDSMLSTRIENGYVFAQVIFDDGSVQEFVDEEFGADLVAVQSALTPLGG